MFSSCRFSTSTSPILERLDRWSVSWQSQATQKLSRILDQNSYDHQAATKESKNLERIVLDAFDKCQAASVEQETVRPKVEARDNKVLEDKAVIRSDNSVSRASMTNSNLSDEPSLETSEKDLGCEDPNLVESGVSKVFRVGGASTNTGGRDFNIRFCEQKAAGGGWTVSERLVIYTGFPLGDLIITELSRHFSSTGHSKAGRLRGTERKFHSGMG